MPISSFIAPSFHCSTHPLVLSFKDWSAKKFKRKRKIEDYHEISGGAQQSSVLTHASDSDIGGPNTVH